MATHSLLRLGRGLGDVDSLVNDTPKTAEVALGEIEREITSFGLSSNEARIYVHLARNDAQRAREVSETLSIHRTETYHLLTSLQNRGLVTSTFQHPIRFLAEPLEKALTILTELEKERLRTVERRKPQLISIWKSLPKEELTETVREGFQILEGPTRVYLRLKEMAKNAKSEISIAGAENDLARLQEFGIFDQMKSMERKNVACRVLRVTKSFEKEFRAISKGFSFRSVSNEPYPTHFAIADGQELLFFLKHGNVRRKEISALWTNYSAFAQTLSLLFSGLWNKSQTERVQIPSELTAL